MLLTESLDKPRRKSLITIVLRWLHVYLLLVYTRRFLSFWLHGFGVSCVTIPGQDIDFCDRRATRGFVPTDYFIIHWATDLTQDSLYVWEPCVPFKIYISFAYFNFSNFSSNCSVVQGTTLSTLSCYATDIDPVLRHAFPILMISWLSADRMLYL
jgi:hypothetical protein